MVNLTRQKRYIFKVLSLIYEASHLPTIYNAKNIFGNKNWGTCKTPEGGDLWKNKHNEVGFWSHSLCGEEFLMKDIISFPLSKSFLAKCTKTPLIELFNCWLMRESKKMASLKTHMLHSGEANVREDRTQGPILRVELRGAQDWAATGSRGKTLLGRKTQIKPEGNNWKSGQHSDGLKVLCFNEVRWKAARSSFAGVRSPGDILLGKLDIPMGKKKHTELS